MSPPTQVANRYVIERRLGAGGMSTVFMATDTVLERRVAVKLLAEHLADDEAFVARFRREALSAARLQHPNIVQVFDSGQDSESGRHYIVMEYVDGPSCADLLRERRELGLEQTVRATRDACHGLDYAHRAGVIHRDVKPGNLLQAEETWVTKLADFGIAKAAEQTRITQAGSILGTAAYLSPEQARGDEAGPASDIYSLGVCAYQFLTGRLPHEYASLTELALKQQQDPVTPIAEYRPEVPRELDDAVRLSLEPDPSYRYASALDMAQALEAGLQGETTEVTRRLTQDDAYDATRQLDDTAATRAMAATRVVEPDGPPTSAGPPAEAAARAPRRAEKDARRAATRRRWGTFLALLAVLAAVAVVVVALSSSGDGGAQAPNANDVEQQIQDLRDFIEENTR
ncbi:MAG: protein kinase [Thermoleophilaceae bacterium]